MTATTTPDQIGERQAAVSALLDHVRHIVAKQGVTRGALDDISEHLQAFAAERAELFTAADFPPPQVGSGDTSTRYRLNPGEDGFALYLNSLLPGKTTIPHNHDTWAVIAALEGEELNRVYQRTDDGSDAERATLNIEREVVVRPGTPIAFLPEDIHSIHVTGAAPTTVRLVPDVEPPVPGLGVFEIVRVVEVAAPLEVPAVPVTVVLKPGCALAAPSAALLVSSDR